MNILNFKFDNSFFELYAALLLMWTIELIMIFRWIWLMMSKEILKTAGYTNFLIRVTYFIDKDRNQVCSYRFEETN